MDCVEAARPAAWQWPAFRASPQAADTGFEISDTSPEIDRQKRP
jgi:hypothetical protein